MNIILGPVGSGRTTLMLQKAKRLADRFLPVLIISDELDHSDIINLGEFEVSTPARFLMPRNMTDILSAVGTASRFEHIFIDVNFLDIKDMQFLSSLSEYIETDMTLSIQTARSSTDVPTAVEMPFEHLQAKYNLNK